MKTYQVTEVFIKEAYNSACPTWKDKIKNEFPDAFKNKEELNKWYIVKSGSDKWIVLFTSIDSEKRKGCGANLNSNNWDDSMHFFFAYDDVRTFTLATEEEIKSALVKEAEKRGFKEKVRIKNLLGEPEIICIGKSFVFKNNQLWFDTIGCIFDNGKWAEIIQETKVSLTDLIESYKKHNNVDNITVV